MALDCCAESEKAPASSVIEPDKNVLSTGLRSTTLAKAKGWPCSSTTVPVNVAAAAVVIATASDSMKNGMRFIVVSVLCLFFWWQNIALYIPADDTKG